jgi:hypothetical protein
MMKGRLSADQIENLLARISPRNELERRRKRLALQRLEADAQNRQDASGLKRPIRADDPRFGSHSELSSGDV